MSKKSDWIASQMPEENADDILDVLLNNITQPSRFVAMVKSLEAEYDKEMEDWSRKHNL